MGGQLQGKGVDVENYPGLANVTGPEVVAAMREQAASFGAVFECEKVVKVDTSKRPFKIHTNSTIILSHSIIVATGAESNWMDIPGEYEIRNRVKKDIFFFFIVSANEYFSELLIGKSKE